MKKQNKLLVRILSIIGCLAMVLSVFAANKLNATPVTARTGYHIDYHNGGNWTNWGQTVPGCNNMSQTSETRQCIHYLNHWIINTSAQLRTDERKTTIADTKPTDVNDPRFQEAYNKYGQYSFWYYGGYAALTTEGTIWHQKTEFIWTNFSGTKYGVAIYEESVRQWYIYDYNHSLVNRLDGTPHDVPYFTLPNNAGEQEGCVSQPHDIRLYYVDSSTDCSTNHKGKFLNKVGYTAWNCDGTSSFSIDYNKSGVRSYNFTDEIIKFTDVLPDNCRYFYGKSNLKEKTQYYPSFGRYEYPSYACAMLGTRGKGFDRYDANGNVVWNYDSAAGYEMEGLTHTVYRYKCDGHLIPNTYTVVYNGNGATGGSTPNSYHTYDVAQNLSGNGFSRTNYHFKGWSTNSGATTAQYSNSQSVSNLTATNGGTVNLYAVWEPDNKTVTYIDRVQGTSTQLGSRTASKPYGSTVAGSDIGADKTLHKYYTNYEYVSCTSATVGANGATVYRDFKLGIAPYTVHHQQEQLNGSYVTVKTDTPTGIIGSNVTPPVNTYTGFTSPPTKTVTVAANGSTTVIYQYKRNSYPVTFIDLINGTELGRTTSQRKYQATVNGNEIGGSTADNAYYKNYKLTSTTSATVNTNGATVYRYFEWLTVNVDGTISWTDNSGKWGTRPSSVKVALFQNKNSVTRVDGAAGANHVSTEPIIGLASLSNNRYSFSFRNLPVYDSNGVAYVYEVRQGNANDTITYSTPSHVSSMINPEDKYVTSQNKYNIDNVLDNTGQGEDDIPEDSNGFHVDGAIHWVDSGNRLGYRPETVTISLYRDGQPFLRDGVHYTQTIDSKNDNTYSFIRLPKYKYENGEPVPYEYTTVETISSVYLVDGKAIPAYDIHADEEYGNYKKLHFTNYFKTSDIPFIPFIPEDLKDNVIEVKTNTEEPIDVTIKMLDYIADGSPDDIDRVDGPGYNGVEYNITVDELGEIIKHIPSGKFEIEIGDDRFELNDITVDNNTDNVHIVKEDDKYYLVIEDTPEDSWGTVNIDLTKKMDNYQSCYRISNYFAATSWNNGISLMSLYEISSETEAVTAELPKFSVTYNTEEDEVIDDNKYGYGDIVVIKDYDGESSLAYWKNADIVLEPGDTIEIKENIVLEPVFVYGITYNDSDVIDESEYKKGETATIKSFEGETPEGMKFIKWMTDDETFYLEGDEVEISGDIELYPIFEKKAEEPNKESSEAADEKISEDSGISRNTGISENPSIDDHSTNDELSLEESDDTNKEQSEEVQRDFGKSSDEDELEEEQTAIF